MLKSLIEGLALGLSLGSSCLATCTPVYIPFLMSGKKSIGKSFLKVMEISAGRFISYLSFGAVAGLLGAQIQQFNRLLFTSVAYILLSVFLLLSALRQKQKDHNCRMSKRLAVTKSGFVLGILTGINFCPSFLIAITKAVNLGGVGDGVSLFGGFFIGTSLFLLPLAIFGVLSTIQHMKKIAMILSVIVAFWFLGKGILGLQTSFSNLNTTELSAMNPAQEVQVISDKQNYPYFMSFRDSLKAKRGIDVAFSAVDKIEHKDHNPNLLYLIDSDLSGSSSFKTFEDSHHTIILDKELTIMQLLGALNSNHFRVDNGEFLSKKLVLSQP